MLQHLNPLPDPSVAQIQARERAARLSRLFNLLDAGREVPSAELEAAYRDVVVDLPGGASLLSVDETRKLLARLDGRHDLGTHSALSMAKMLTESARVARQRLRERPGSERELEAWRRLLGARSTARVLVLLISRGSWMVTKMDVVQAMEALRMLDEERPLRSPASRGSTLDLVLDVIARAAYTPRSEERYPNEDAYLVDSDSAGPSQQRYGEPPDSDLLKPWKWDVLNDPEKPLDIETAMSSYSRLWSAMEATEGINFKAFSYASRIKMEGKMARKELLDYLQAWTEGAPSSHSSSSSSAKPFGFERVRQTLREAAEQGLLSVAHIHEALGQFSAIAYALREAMSYARVDAHKREPIVRSLLAAKSPRDGEWLFRASSSSSSSSMDQSLDEQMRQVYEALRWNSVRKEMAELHSTKEPRRGSGSSGDIAGSKPTVFEQLFGLTLSLVRPSHASSLAGTAGDQQNDSLPREHLPLLGIPLPDHICANEITQEVLIRHYAVVSGNFEAMREVVADYRSSGSPAAAPPQPATLFTSDDRGIDGGQGAAELVGLPLRVGTLYSVIRGFAFHGVPFVLTHDEATEREVWQPREDLAEELSPAQLQWNIVRLNEYVDELLRLKPRTAAMRAREAERARERKRLREVAAAAAVAGRPGPSRQGARAGWMARRHDNKGTEDDERLATAEAESEDAKPSAPWATQLDLSPSPRQVFFILTALRRCMGDEHDDRVLEVFRRLEAKFGYGRNGGGSEEAAEHWKPNRNGWRGWRMDNRLRRLVDFLQERRDGLEEGVVRTMQEDEDDDYDFL